MGKAISKVVGVIVSPLSLIDKDLGRAVTAIALTTAGIVTGNFALISAGVSMGASLLAPKPKSPSTSAASLDRLQASINLRTPRTMVFGSTAMATDIRDQEWSNGQDYLHRFPVVASHRVRGIREIWFDDKLAWSASGGVTSTYAGYLTITPVLEGSAANAINIGPRMGSSRRYTGCAYVYIRYKLNGNSKKTDSPFAGGSIPSRMTIIGDGIPVADPRVNGFVPSDQSTWSTDASACRNPALVALTYLLGWRINAKLAVGKGIPPERIDLASFATAANICDEPVTRPSGTTEPRYRCDGVVSEGDDTGLVLDNLKATMNAVLDDVDGKIRLSVLYNDLATPIGELTAADVLGEFTWDQTPPLSDTFNIVRGGYTDPSTTSLYQMVDYPEVSIASADGIDRIETVNLPMVQSAGQAQRLAKLRLARQQYGGTFQAVFQATAWKFQKGDAIRFSFYPLGWDKKLFRIADMTIQVDGTVPMMLREESPAIYAAYSDETSAIAGTAPTTYDPSLWPVIQGLVDVEAQIARAVSDGWLDPSEKRQAKIDYDQRTAQRDALQARYVALGSPASVTDARNAAFARMQDLYNYLQSLSPSWLDYSTQTQVPDPTAYQAAWKAASEALEAFSAAITGLEGPPGKDGASAFTLIASGPVEVQGGALVKTSGELGGGYSQQGYRGGALCSFRPGQSGGANVFAGLNADPIGDDYAAIDYCWFLTEGGAAQIYESGNFIAQQFQGYDPSYVFQVAYDNGKVRWLCNGNVYREVAVAADRLFYFDSTLGGGAGTSLLDIAFVASGAAGENGEPGDDGFGVVAAPAAFVIPATSLGATKATWQGGSCKITLNKGGQPVAADSYSYANVQNVASIAISGHTITFQDITSDKGSFIARATLGGVNYDQEVTIVKTRDGSAAFVSSTTFSGNVSATGQANTTVPKNKTVTLTSSATYDAAGSGTGNRSGRGRLTLSWRNLTDNGAWNILGTVDGSLAQIINRGSSAEPDYEYIPGSVSAGFSFTSPTEDKQLEYRAEFVTIQGQTGNIQGALRLEVTA
ncbi:hypothetical protein [Sphingomonas metalli]|nr:hypothetical protein [Sphingomonas metalli]